MPHFIVRERRVETTVSLALCAHKAGDTSEPSSAGRNQRGCGCCGEPSGRSSKGHTESSRDPALPLWGRSHENHDVCPRSDGTQVSRAAVLVIAAKWGHPLCPGTEGTNEMHPRRLVERDLARRSEALIHAPT